MGIALLNQSFNGGVISPLMTVRTDKERYQSGAITMQNIVCIAQGSATRRPGMPFMGLTNDQDMANPVRVMPFIFSETESRVLEVGVGYIRIWKNDGVVGGGTPYEITTNYTADDVPDLWIEQSADVVFIASGNHPPAKLSRFADDNWTIEDIDFIPTAEVPTNLAATKTASGSEITYKYKITAIDNTTGEESLPTDEVVIKSTSLSSSNTITLTWTATSDPLEYRIYKEKAGIFGYIGTATAGTETFTDNNIGADEEDGPPMAENPFTGPGEYPRIVFFWEQRLGWAASYNKPLTNWMSPNAQFESLAAAKPPVDSDAIEATLAGQRVNRIQWVAGDRTLVMGTQGSEWSIGKDGEALTPNSISFQRQSGVGSNALAPLQTASSLLFLQRGGKTVREMNYTYSEDRYVVPDLSIWATHLLDNNVITRWAYQLNPYSICWCVLDDGSLIGLTYMPEHKVVGWHHHETDGVIEDICCVPGEGFDDVWFVVRRTIDGVEKRFIEKFGDYFIRSNDPAGAFFVDSGVRYSGAETDTIIGLDHLEGMTVKVWADGVEQSDKIVSGGQIMLDLPASNVAVGLGFESELTPTRPEVLAADGTTLTRVYNVASGNMRFYKSMGVWAGRDEDNLEEVIKYDAADPSAPAFVTGDRQVTIATGWTEEWNVIIRVPGPTPFTLRAVTWDVQIGDTI